MDREHVKGAADKAKGAIRSRRVRALDLLSASVPRACCEGGWPYRAHPTPQRFPL
jgi:hypothetical protein